MTVRKIIDSFKTAHDETLELTWSKEAPDNGWEVTCWDNEKEHRWTVGSVNGVAFDEKTARAEFERWR